MKKKLERDSDELLTVSPDKLAAMLDCGRATAVKIGTAAGAKITVGKRTLYKVSIIDKYLDSIALNASNE